MSAIWFCGLLQNASAQWGKRIGSRVTYYRCVTLTLLIYFYTEFQCPRFLSPYCSSGDSRVLSQLTTRHLNVPVSSPPPSCCHHSPSCSSYRPAHPLNKGGGGLYIHMSEGGGSVVVVGCLGNLPASRCVPVSDYSPLIRIVSTRLRQRPVDSASSGFSPPVPPPVSQFCATTSIANCAIIVDLVQSRVESAIFLSLDIIAHSC